MHRLECTWRLENREPIVQGLVGHAEEASGGRGEICPWEKRNHGELLSSVLENLSVHHVEDTLGKARLKARRPLRRLF